MKETTALQIRTRVPRATCVAFAEDRLVVKLADGRIISVPLQWFPSLANASPKQRDNYRLLWDGRGISWPDLDEDLSVAGLLRP